MNFRAARGFLPQKKINLFGGLYVWQIMYRVFLSVFRVREVCSVVEPQLLDGAPPPASDWHAALPPPPPPP